MLRRPSITKRVKLVSIYAGCTATLLGLLITYHQLDGPTLAMDSDLAKIEFKISQVEQFNIDTRALLLNEKWDRVHRELSELRTRLITEPRNQDLRDRIYNLESSLRLINQQLEDLEEGN